MLFPLDKNILPTGEIISLKNTKYDFFSKEKKMYELYKDKKENRVDNDKKEKKIKKLNFFGFR